MDLAGLLTKGEEKSMVICFGNMWDLIRKECRAEARQANPREIVDSILHESLYLLEGEIKRYIRIRDCNVQVHINGEGKQEHVSCIYVYKAGGIMFVYILCKVCLHRTLAD